MTNNTSINQPDKFESLEQLLLCPVMLEPLTEAVTLVPCAHKVQKVAAEELFGKTNGGWLVQSEKPCPLCRVNVLGYMRDHHSRNIVKELYALPDTELKEILAKMKEDLPEKSIIVEKDLVIPMSFPGKQARFIHGGGDWSLLEGSFFGPDLFRIMMFESATAGSTFNDFVVVGKKDEKFEISVGFPEKNADALEKYFRQYDIILDSEDKFVGRYFSKNYKQLKTLFKIIAENNEIPSDYFDKIKNIVLSAKD